MKTKLQLILTVLILSLAVFGCRKEDATPFYNYFGGGGEASTTDETPEETGEVPVDKSKPVEYEKIDLENCDTSSVIPESGFVDTKDEFASKWTQWCPNIEAPSVNFDDKFVAYYFAQPMPCERFEFKDIKREGENLILDIEKRVVTSEEGKPECVCILLFKKTLFLYAVERTSGSAEFKETTVNVPCGEY